MDKVQPLELSSGSSSTTVHILAKSAAGSGRMTMAGWGPLWPVQTLAAGVTLGAALLSGPGHSSDSCGRQSRGPSMELQGRAGQGGRRHDNCVVRQA